MRSNSTCVLDASKKLAETFEGQLGACYSATFMKGVAAATFPDYKAMFAIWANDIVNSDRLFDIMMPGE